ncbi:hypothetical protein RRG08_008458 [Elysia crispata]|uniref:Uncharacterized protein n=1 Tax=Elysia crispata TaxID=231223 RepID=A0AAE1E8B7_9GAST|nr:hypothetical protein RRG08_008458 [Elysia crispata]
MFNCHVKGHIYHEIMRMRNQRHKRSELRTKEATRNTKIQKTKYQKELVSLKAARIKSAHVDLLCERPYVFFQGLKRMASTRNKRSPKDREKKMRKQYEGK